MRSAIHHQFGDPTNVLVPGDSPLPEPAPGEVRIRMQLAPIHNHDLLTVRGQYGYKPALPAIGGSEGLGVVDALGAGVEGLAVGCGRPNSGAPPPTMSPTRPTCLSPATVRCPSPPPAKCGSACSWHRSTTTTC